MKEVEYRQWWTNTSRGLYGRKRRLGDLWGAVGRKFIKYAYLYFLYIYTNNNKQVTRPGDQKKGGQKRVGTVTKKKKGTTNKSLIYK